ARARAGAAARRAARPSGRGHTQTLLHGGTRGRVLQKLLLGRIEMMLDGEGRQRRLVKARQDQLLLARVGVDVADREDPGNVRLKLLGVDLDGLAGKLEAPLGDRAELGR